MRAISIAIVAAVLTLTAAVPAASAPGTGSSFGADVGAAWLAGSDGASTATVAPRRCRTLARRRLARIRGASMTKARRVTARRRVRTKLRRCLTAARPVTPAPPAGGAPPAPDSPSPPPPGGGTPEPGPALPGFVGVTASDDDGFRLTLSRPAVAAGDVTIELRNTDSGPHDLVVEPDGGGTELARFDPLEPGSTPVRRTVELPAGRWRLYCSLPNHALAGMQATLRAE